VKISIHTPNRRIEGQEIAQMVALGGHDYLVYDASPHGRDWGYWHSIILEIKHHDPAAKIHLRIENRGDLPSLDDAVAQIKAAWDEIGTLADTYRFGNEPDLERPGVSIGAYHAWSLDLIRRIPAPMGLYLPALSGNASGEWFLSCSSLLSGGEYAGWDAHCYGNTGEFETQLAKYRSRYDGPILITEFNYGPGPGRSYDAWGTYQLKDIAAAASRASVLGLIYFAWEWHNPDNPHWSQLADVLHDGALRDIITELNKSSLPAPSPEPIPDTEEGMTDEEKHRLGLYARWSLARIDADEDPRDVWAFIAHLEALDADRTQPYNYGLPYRFETVPFVRGGSS